MSYHYVNGVQVFDACVCTWYQAPYLRMTELKFGID